MGFLGGIGDDDAALDGFGGVDALQHDAVRQGLDGHETSYVGMERNERGC